MFQLHFGDLHREVHNVRVKLAKTVNHITFLTQCQKLHLVPYGFRIKQTVLSKKAKELYDATKCKLAKLQLDEMMFSQ